MSLFIGVLLPFISLSDHNARGMWACTGNVEVTTTPLETKPREGCRKHTGPADCDPKGHGSLLPKGSLGTNEFVASGLFPFNG
jgi:hypothetical protein